jgi:hypothetical protein
VHLWITPIALLLTCHAALCQELVINEPLTKSQLIASLPVLALRKLPVEQVIAPTNDTKHGWVVSVSAAVGSALSSKPTTGEEWLSSDNGALVRPS